MTFFKKIMFVGILVLCVFVYHDVYAQTNNACSLTKRDELARTDKDTYKILYNITDPLLLQYINKNYGDFDLNKTISWEPFWYDNNKWWCNNLGLFTIGVYNNEVQNWNSFWSKYWSVASIVNWGQLTNATVTLMQNYIRDYCGLNMWTDGQLWKKTIHSINICMPPSQWKLLRSDFKALTQDKKALFIDIEWKIPIYSGTSFDVNFKPDDMYVDITNSTAISKWITDETKATSKWLKVVKKNITICEKTFWSSYNSVQNDLKEESWKCCYQWNKVWSNIWVWSPNADQRKIEWKNAIYTVSSQSLTLTPPFVSLPPSITILVCWTSSDAPVCRFTPPTDSIERQKYDTQKAKLGTGVTIPTDCKAWCEQWSIEKKIWKSSVCEKCDPEKCNCGIKLNTSIPFIGRCIINAKTNNTWKSGDTTTVSILNAFPVLMGALIKLLMSVIMLVCFASLIIWWFMMTIPDQYETGKWMIKKVVRTIVALWSLWTILYLINPNFFS